MMDRATERQNGRVERAKAVASSVKQVTREDANSGGSHWLPRFEGD